MINYYTHKKLGKKQGNPRAAIQLDDGVVHTIKMTKEDGKTRKHSMVRVFEFEPAFDGYTNGMIKNELKGSKLSGDYQTFLFAKKDTNEKS